MKSLKFFGAVAFAGLLLAGCSSVAHVERDKTVNFSNYQTYDWVETSKDKNDSVKSNVSDLTEKRIRQAVDEELAKSGWRAARNKPDVFISYDVLVERGTKNINSPVYSDPYTRYFYNRYTRRWNSIHYPSQFLGYDNEQRSVKEGTITISLIDAKSGNTIWQGWTTDEVNSSNLTSREIQNSIKSIFRKFDIAKN